MHAADDRKELKIKIPVRQHLTLHKLKILTGRNMGEIVEEALAAYLRSLKTEADAPAGAAGA